MRSLCTGGRRLAEIEILVSVEAKEVLWAAINPFLLDIGKKVIKDRRLVYRLELCPCGVKVSPR